MRFKPQLNGSGSREWRTSTTARTPTHVSIELHEVGDGLHVAVVLGALPYYLVENVAEAGGEDQDRHLLVVQ